MLFFEEHTHTHHESTGNLHLFCLYCVRVHVSHHPCISLRLIHWSKAWSSGLIMFTGRCWSHWIFDILPPTPPTPRPRTHTPRFARCRSPSSSSYSDVKKTQRTFITFHGVCRPAVRVGIPNIPSHTNTRTQTFVESVKWVIALASLRTGASAVEQQHRPRPDAGKRMWEEFDHTVWSRSVRPLNWWNGQMAN